MASGEVFMQRTAVTIDADTANEVDDLFAIVPAVIDPNLAVRGIGSAQWQQSQWATPQTLEDSQRLSGALMGLMGIDSIPPPRGAHRRLYDWGQTLAHHCHAAHHTDPAGPRHAPGARSWWCSAWRPRPTSPRP